ncbi:MAG: histone deacetylase [Chloroflexi bacterium]|nr:histone deacetylase [Chloroflexota bacterium]
MSTCYAYDAIEQQHTLPGHPEHHSRLQSTLHMLQETGLLKRLHALRVQPISDERLALCHPRAYTRRVAQLAAKGGGHLDPDTYVVPGSYEAALMAAGAAVDLSAAILGGEASNGMSLMRPPGHHALADRGMGFCIFNNIALAAHVTRHEHLADRVLIIDYDVHHGNGTQALTESDPNIAYISTHLSPFYPGTGAATDIGRGPGAGSVLNIPLPAGVGDRAYQQLTTALILPFARRFRPDLILVSAGYDAHWRDPLASAQLSLSGYARLVQNLQSLAQDMCQGRIAFILEGGYDLEVMAYGVTTTLGLLADPQAAILDPLGPAPHPEPDIQSLIHQLQTIHHLPSRGE